MEPACRSVTPTGASTSQQDGLTYKIILCKEITRALTEGCTHVMHGRSRMTVDPRIPTMPGQSTSGFTDQADIASNKREAP